MLSQTELQAAWETAKSQLPDLVKLNKNMAATLGAVKRDLETGSKLAAQQYEQMQRIDLIL